MVLTIHRWFANKSCPGNWLYARLGDLAARVTANLGGSQQSTPSAPTTSKVPYKVRVKIPDLNIRKGPGTNYAKWYKFTGAGVFTIVEEATGLGATKWGLLKSYADKRNGWISLDYATKL